VSEEAASGGSSLLDKFDLKSLLGKKDKGKGKPVSADA
jgi:hypothetical protein